MIKGLCREILLKCKLYLICFVLLDIDFNIILKEFGGYFFEFCRKLDFNYILMILVGNFYNFMENWRVLYSYLF